MINLCKNLQSFHNNFTHFVFRCCLEEIEKTNERVDGFVPAKSPKTEADVAAVQFIKLLSFCLRHRSQIQFILNTIFITYKREKSFHQINIKLFIMFL